MSTPVCVEDIEKSCRFDNNARCYYMSGADEQQTLSENLQAFKRFRIRLRMLQGIEEVNTSTTILGEQISFPVCISPTALHCLAHIDGEKATVKDIRKASPSALLWMQMYVFTDIDLTLKLLRIIEVAGYKAVVLTIDTPMFGAQRERIRHNFKLPRNLEAANLVGMNTILDTTNDKKSELLKNISWDTVDWLRSRTKLPIILKGILTREDAIECLNHDVQGIMVSNHGGRQLDCVPATIEALAEIVEAVNGKLEVYLDGGIRIGSDVFKALALGAKAVFIGRPVLWGLGYNGEEGVSMVLDFLKTEFKRTMHHAGCRSVENINKSMVVHESRL